MEVDWNLVFEIFKEMLPSLYPLIGVTIALNLSLIIFRFIRRILDDYSCASDTDDLGNMEYEEVAGVFEKRVSEANET